MMHTVNMILLAFATLAVILPGIALAVGSMFQRTPGDCPAAFRAAQCECEGFWRAALAGMDDAPEGFCEAPTPRVVRDVECAARMADAAMWPAQVAYWQAIHAEHNASRSRVRVPSGGRRLSTVGQWRAMVSAPARPLLGLAPPLPLAA